MSSDNYEQKYTKPKLRRKLKKKIKNSDKGGKKGQWSARKSQLLVQKYEKKGGGYKKDENDKSTKSLKEWSDQEWQTKEGKGKARAGSSVKRYLPKKAWQKLSKKEKKEAENSKIKKSKSGKQYVEWPAAVKRVMQELGYSDKDSGESSKSKKELYEKAKKLNISGRSKMNKSELRAAIAKH